MSFEHRLSPSTSPDLMHGCFRTLSGQPVEPFMTSQILTATLNEYFVLIKADNQTRSSYQELADAAQES